MKANLLTMKSNVKNCSALFDNSRKPAGNKAITSFNPLRLAAMVTLLLTLACGQMWGYNRIQLRSDYYTGGWSYTSGWFTYGDEGKKYWDVYHTGSDSYWRINIEYYATDYGPSTNNYVMNQTGNKYKVDEKNSAKAFKTTGNAGVLRIYTNQVDDGGSDEYPKVWVVRPSVEFKYCWNGGSWTKVTATDNNDGTYTYKGRYGGTGYFNAGPNGADKVAKTTTTVIGSPSTGNYCQFKWTGSGYKYTGDEETNRGVFVITKLCTITYNANGSSSGTKPSDQTDILYNTSTTLRTNTGSLAKTNFVFTGWNTKADGTGDHYDAGASFTPTPSGTSVTLYAEWQPVWNLKGSWDSWGDFVGMSYVSANKFSVTKHLDAGTYTFKIVQRTGASTSTWWGKTTANATFTRSDLTSALNLVSTAGDSYNMRITADVDGDYTFTFIHNGTDANGTGKKILVKYPCATANQTLYKFEVSSSRTSGSVCSSTSTLIDLTSEYALSKLAGGTLSAYETSSGKIKYVSGGAIQLSENSTNHYLKIDLDCPLQANDIIRFTNTAKASASVYLRHTSNTTSTNQVTLAGASTDAIVELPDAFATKSSLWIVRGGDNSNAIKSVEILRPYVVTLNTHGGTCSASTIKTMAGKVILPHSFKDGYLFNGWYTAESGGSKQADYYTASGSTTLHAQYTEGCPSSGTVFSMNMESSMKPGSTVYPPFAGSMDLIPYATITYGSAFAGNKHASSNYGGVTNAGIVQLNNANAYIKIDLDCALQTGDVISVVSNTSSSNQYYVTSESTRSSTYTTSGTSTKTHTYTVTGSESFDKTLYIWEGSSSVVVESITITRPTKYTVSYNSGGGSGSMSSHTNIVKGSNQALTSNTFEKTGYTFSCWHADVAVKVGGSTISAGGDIADGATLQDISSDVTLTAQWTCTTPTFGTDLSTTQVDYSVDDTPDNLEVAASASGADIDYQWYSNDENNYTTPTELDGETSTTFTPSTSSAGTTYYFCVATNHTCSSTANSAIAKIVVSEVTTYTVTLDPDNGNSTKTVTATYGEAMPSTTKPSYTGYTFRGYYDDHAGGGTQYYDATPSSVTSWDKASTATLYAKWTQSITLDRNGGDGSTNKTAPAIYKGTGPFAPSGTQTYSGHSLVDYRTSDGTTVLTTAGAFAATNVSDGSSVAYISGGKWVKAAGTTLYAHWKCNTPTISCTNNVVTITVPSGSIVYYTTDGSTTPTSSSTEYDPENKPVIDETTTFKAIAIQSGCDDSDVATQECEYVVSYSVTYNANDKTSGSAPTDATAYSEDATVTVLGNTGSLARTGYVFCGWSTSYGGGTAYAPGETFTITSNVNLYPIWAEGTSATITYTLNVGTSASTTIKSSATDNNDHIENVDIDQTYDGASGVGAENRTTKLAIKTGANGENWSTDPTNYEQFKFSVASGYSFTPSDITIKIANVGSSSANNIKYKAVLSDGNSHSISTTYICTTQNGTVETFHLYNTGTVAFSGNVTLKLWAWTIADISNGGSGFRMGTPLTIDGAVLSTCTPLTAEGGTGSATSITKSGASLPYTLTNTTGVASVTIKVYDSEDNLVETIAGLSAAASGSGSATSLSAGTTYYYTVTPIASSGYCDGEESDPSDAFTTKYGVTYAAGVTLTSGSVPTDANAYDEGDDATVLGNTGSMVYTGYTFRGWTYNGAFYLAGQSFEITDNTTLTAVWDNGSSGDCETIASGTQASSHEAIDATSGSFTVSNPVSGGSDGYIKLNQSGYIEVTAKTGYTPIAAGDKLTVTVYNKNNSAGDIGFKFHSKDESTTHTANIASKSTGNIVYTLVAADIEAGGTIKLFRTSADDRYHAILLERCSSSSNYTVSFEDMSGFAGSSTLPDDIEGVPSGKKIVQPADPTADDYIFGGWYIDAACTSAFNFSGTITKDTTLYAKWSALHTVTWMVNGSEYTTGDPTTETEGSITTMPTAPSAITCSGSFRGWSATNLYGEAVVTPPADLFVTAADAPAIIANTVFYAIFGDAASASATDFTSTFTSKAWADSGSKWRSIQDGGQLTSGRGIQVTTTNNDAKAITKAEYKAVTKVVVTYSTNSSSGAGSIEIKVGGTAVSGSADVTTDGGETDRTINYIPATSLDGKVQIYVNCTTNSIYIKSVQIYHSGTFENYRCICPTMTVTPKLVTASTPIFITSAASKTVRSQDSLVIVGSGLSKSTPITLSSPASKFELRSRTNGVISTDATGSIDTVAYIYYTPGAGDTSDGLDKNANFTVSVAGNGAKDVTVSQALIGRHVPTNFVIAAKSGDNWYALPADMSSTSTPTPVEIIAVDNESDPTTARTPEENVYSLYPPTNNNITSGNGQYIRLGMHGVAKEGSLPAPLFGSATGTYTLGKSGTSVITNDLPSGGWWWKLQQTNTSVTDSKYATYNLYGANNTNSLKIYTGPKWGLYASGVDEIRLIPWLANYRVFFEDGNLTPASHTTWPDNIESVLSGETIDEPTDPEADGYTFIGWYKEAECTNAWNFATDVITEATTLYAKWTGSDYNITYHLDGASWVSTGAATYTSGVGYTLPVAGDMTNIGYTFNGWYANSDLSTGGVVTAIGISETGDKEFWAKWTENTYTVTYDKNGGSGSDMSSTIGHYVTLSNNAYTAPSGKIFVEWNTASDGTGTGYGEGEDVELKADLDLYAIWANDYTITWGNVQIGGAGATVTPNLGGGNYTITASVSLWTGTLTTSMISALTDGVTITNVAVDNSSSPKTITATFNVGASVAGESISFELDVPAAGIYGAKSSPKDIDIDRCTGSEAIIYSMRMTAYNACEVNSTYGGSCALGSYDSGNTVTANGHTHYKPSGTLFTVTLKSGVTFQAGDSLVLYMTASKDTKTTGYKICQSAGSSTLVLAVTKEMTSGTEYHVTSKLTAAMTTIVGASSIRLDRYNGDTRFYGIDIIRPAGGGSGSSKITPTLTWDTDLSGGVAAETGDADFTHTVTQNKNSLGAITYSSSNTSVVTVNATTGKVHIVGAGDATITATIAASGCYEKATATYNIHAEDNCEDIAGTIGTEDLGCSGIKLTVTGHTTTASTSYQWYKVGSPDETVGTNQDNYTATAAGEYYVIVDNTAAGSGHCAMASANTITVEAQTAATATKLVDEWYVKNGRRTPDIALVQTENADNFQVKSGSTVIWDTKESVVTGFAGCSFYLGEDGIIYLKGQKDDETVPGGLSAGDETLKFTAKACGGDADDVEITIHKQAATTRPSVAFVVDGTKEGDFDAENEDHSVGTALYDYLDYTRNGSGALDLFDLTPQNVYSTVDEKAIRQHYSQFDAIIITDDPSTSTKIGKKSCVDAFGTMIDIRPILTMEAYVSSLSNWKAKGISGNPTSPNPRQYAMKLECKDHAIFNGLNPASDNVHVDTEGGVDYWTVTMVDKTKSPYAGLDDDEETGGGEKPALQGFSASNVDGLLLLGEISEGTLYTGVERQDEPAARLMLLGVQYKALPSALTPEGLIVIKNALKYLLKTDMEEVDDCSNYFTDAYGDHKWSTAANWSKGKAPDVTVKARILKPCVIDGTAYAAQVDIATSGKSSKFDTPADCSGKLTIDPTGALIVGGEVHSAKAPYFNTGDLKPTEATDLVLNTNGSNQSALILDNDEGDTKATVNLYSLGRKYDDKYQYQYFAIPMEYLPVNPTFANENHGGTKIYTYVWEEGTSSWTRRKYYDDLFAFEGLGITTNSSETHMDYTMTGNLTSTAERDITLTADGAGNNIIGNSYTAPISIASLVSAFADDESVTKTVYIYCAGRDAEKGIGASGSTETAGQWLAIPIEAAAFELWTGLKVIPAMQAFCINANTGTTLTLNYKDHVRSTASAQLNQPLRAPKREAEAEGIDLMRIRVADSKTHTDLYLFEGEQFSEAFDNGWEAKYMSGDGRSAKLYAETTIGQLAVAAQPEYEGTVLGFAPGQETEYIFTFSGPDKEYYLNDLRLKKSTLISEGESYLFTFEEGDTNRFYISKTRIDAPAVATGTENTADGAKARKVIVNDKLYIIRNGRVYSAEGIIVK